MKTRTASKQQIAKRLEYLRGELRAERISWGELHELQSLLLEAAGVSEEEAMAKGLL